MQILCFEGEGTCRNQVTFRILGVFFKKGEKGVFFGKKGVFLG